MHGLRGCYIVVLLLMAALLLPGFAGAVDETDFKLESTEDLIDLATTSPDDPLYPHAINFLHGFLVGAYHYHEAMAMGPEGVRLFCPPDQVPSRNEVINEFIGWAKKHPEYWKEPAVETEFRFLMEKWPCKR